MCPTALGGKQAQDSKRQRNTHIPVTRSPRTHTKTQTGMQQAR